MARAKTLSGEVLTVTETKAGLGVAGHWFTIAGTAQGIVEYLNENNIPEHKVKGCLPSSSTWYVLYHK